MINLIHNDAMGKLVLRLTVAILMLFHGVAKIIHPGSLEFIGNSLTAIGMPSAVRIFFPDPICLNQPC